MRPIRSLFGPSYLPEVSMTDGSNGTWLSNPGVTHLGQKRKCRICVEFIVLRSLAGQATARGLPPPVSRSEVGFRPSVKSTDGRNGVKAIVRSPQVVSLLHLELYGVFGSPVRLPGQLC